METAPTFLSLTTQTWLYIGSAILFVFGLVIFSVGGGRDSDERAHTMIHGTVCIIAGTAYFAMASGVLDTTLADGRNYDFGRYVDWTFTTPLLLYGLAMTAVRGHPRFAIVLGLIAFDVLMILTGLISGFIPREQMAVKVAWFMLGNVFFLAVLWFMWDRLYADARAHGALVRQIYVRHASIVTFLWFLYPVVFIVGSNQLALIDQAATAALILVLDVAAKGVYGVVSLFGSKTLAEARQRELADTPRRAREPQYA